MTTIKERLYKIAEFEGLSVRAFEEKCNLGRGNISNMSPNGAIGSDKLAKILDTFPYVDLNWILTGKETEPTPGASTSGENSYMLDKLLKQAEEIGRLKQRISELEQRLEKTVGGVNIEGIASAG